MENEGAATSSRRSERSSSTQGVYVPTVGEDMDGVAPKCRCGVYAILYLSKTASNPNRLFFGCPLFNGRMPHCKSFLWLDEHTTKLGVGGAGKRGEEVEDVAEHFCRMEYERRFFELEKRVGAMEQRKKILYLCYVVGFSVVIIAACMYTR
ncbi:hypothetical protein PIB30_009234 [Stylosanthes scabra]|uniref:GRF-type domain-containing protein n=1 Tax=Stylosanthes scabra TaxID=79078 RepID=A0ABU6Q557_9FABA|nr:hypothetical protein [Stylosanthes scabra]